MTSTLHKIMSLILVGITLGIGASIVWSQPEEWLLTSLFFTLLSLGLWYGFKSKREALGREIRIEDDACESRMEHVPEKMPNKSPQHNAGSGPATLNGAIPPRPALSSEKTARPQSPRG